MAHEASCPSDEYWNASQLRDALLRSRDDQAAGLRSRREYLRFILKNLCDYPVAKDVLKSCLLDDKVITFSHLEDVWIWLQKVDAVKVQSYCDSAYSNFRSTMSCDSIRSESVRRSECMRDNYYTWMRHYKEQCEAFDLVDGLGLVWDLSTQDQDQMFELVSACNNIRIQDMACFSII